MARCYDCGDNCTVDYESITLSTEEGRKARVAMHRACHERALHGGAPVYPEREVRRGMAEETVSSVIVHFPDPPKPASCTHPMITVRLCKPPDGDVCFVGCSNCGWSVYVPAIACRAELVTFQDMLKSSQAPSQS